MKPNALPRPMFLYTLLLGISMAFYGSYERLILELKTIGYVQSQTILALFWVWIIYCFRSGLVTFNKIKATLQQVSVPLLIALLAFSSASSVQNLFSFVADTPTNIPYPVNLSGFAKYGLFVRSVILLTIQVVIPSFIALATTSVLKERLSEYKFVRKLLGHESLQ